MKTKPELVCRPPVKPTTLATAGSCWMMSTNCRSFWLIAWNEMLWSPTIPPISRPVSCCGKKPFGIMTNRATLSAIVPAQDTSTSRAWRSAQSSVLAIGAGARARTRLSLACEQPAPVPVRGRAQEPGAQHRRRGQRDDQRDQDRHRQGHRELAEQPPDEAAHQQDRHEHRDQRQADGQHGEADLPRAEQCRLQPRHAGLDVARDVLQHHDGVVDDEAGGDRQRHQRQIVEAVAQQIHGARTCR